MIEGCIHDTKVTLVKWIKPQNHYIKLNAYGFVLNNLGKIGVGGILRSSSGDMIIAFTLLLSEGTIINMKLSLQFLGCHGAFT